MPAPKAIETVQSLSNRELAKQLGKRVAPGVLAIGGLGFTLLLGMTALPAALQAMA